MAELQRTVLKWAGGVVSFDCVEVEDASHDATLTRYPVEDGANLADHLIVEPDAIRLTVHVTNAPIAANKDVSHMDGVQPATTLNLKDAKSLGFANESKVVNDVQPVPFANAVGLTSVAGIQLNIPRKITLEMFGKERFSGVPLQAVVRAWGVEGETAKRVQNIYNELLAAREEARLFTVVTEFRPYDNMVIRNLKMHRSNKNVRAPRFEIELQQLFTAALETRDVSARLPKKDRSKPSQDAGKKQPQAADAKTAGKSKSVAKSIFGSP